MAVALAAAAPAASHRWPRPPAWWLHSPFVECVRRVESGDGTTTRNVYGMLDGWADAGGHGYAGDASRAEQDYRAYRLWRRYGVSAWRPFDGC